MMKPLSQSEINNVNRVHMQLIGTGPEFPDFPEFTPFCSVRSMMAVGTFNGTYFDDAPEDWFYLQRHRVSGRWMSAKQNLFIVQASQSRQQWQDNGWIWDCDPLGWVQWYLRFSNGRRDCDLGSEYRGMDLDQIARWKSFGARHGGAVRKNGGGNLQTRRKQRQSLLHWAHDFAPDINKG